MVIVEGMDNKDAAALEADLETINHVKEVLWYDDMLDLSVPVSMIPDSIRNAFLMARLVLISR